MDFNECNRENVFLDLVHAMNVLLKTFHASHAERNVSGII